MTIETRIGSILGGKNDKKECTGRPFHVEVCSFHLFSQTSKKQNCL